MFVLDDILLSPIRGIALVADKIHEAAQQEFAGEADALRNELREMYMRLEAGELAEADFDAREKTLLDRLDELEKRDADAVDHGPADDP